MQRRPFDQCQDIAHGFDTNARPVIVAGPGQLATVACSTATTPGLLAPFGIGRVMAKAETRAVDGKAATGVATPIYRLTRVTCS